MAFTSSQTLLQRREAGLDGGASPLSAASISCGICGEHLAGARLDGDVDQHEPGFVLPGEEVLDHPDIVERDRARCGRAGPSCRARRPSRAAAAAGRGASASAQIGTARWAGRTVGGFGLAPDIGLHHEGVADHGGAELRRRSPRRRSAFRSSTGRASRWWRTRPVSSVRGRSRGGLLGSRQLDRQCHICGIVGAKKAPFGAHIVVG